ncbi:hypothetical protein ACIRSU_04760 [Streptomyces sp. NPDC101160]|uniref:hypothetical protein n=1 Tax=Streptomyces sp. NPDC101160 TaxID=3366118 RepID=UPI003817D962
MITADDFLTLLVDRVPEARPFVEERYELRPDEAPPTTDTGLDLYGNLLHLLNWPVQQPALEQEVLDRDLLRRSFDLVEDIYDIPQESSQSSVYFTVPEGLLESPRYPAAAIPFLKGGFGTECRAG